MADLDVPLLNPVSGGTINGKSSSGRGGGHGSSSDDDGVIEASLRSERVDPALIAALPLLEKTHLFLHGYLGYASILFMHSIIIIILVNTTAFILSTDDDIAQAIGPDVFQTIETFSAIAFTVEHCLRVWSCTADPEYRSLGAIQGRLNYMISFHGLIDLFAIVPFYIGIFLPLKLSFTTSLRVLRFFRLLKFDNYTRAFGILKGVFIKEKELLLISGFYCFVALVIGASLLYATDSDVPEFETIPLAMYSVFCIFMGTFPESPVTTLSKFIIAATATAGLTLISVPTGIIASGFVDMMNERRELRQAEVREEERQRLEDEQDNTQHKAQKAAKKAAQRAADANAADSDDDEEDESDDERPEGVARGESYNPGAPTTSSATPAISIPTPAATPAQPTMVIMPSSSIVIRSATGNIMGTPRAQPIGIAGHMNNDVYAPPSSSSPNTGAPLPPLSSTPGAPSSVPPPASSAAVTTASASADTEHKRAPAVGSVVPTAAPLLVAASDNNNAPCISCPHCGKGIQATFRMI